jgi:hypothetical protein
MNITLRFNLWRTLGLLLVVLNLAAFGATVADGRWMAFVNLIGATAVMVHWATKDEAKP